MRAGPWWFTRGALRSCLHSVPFAKALRNRMPAESLWDLCARVEQVRRTTAGLQQRIHALARLQMRALCCTHTASSDLRARVLPMLLRLRAMLFQRCRNCWSWTLMSRTRCMW